MPRSQNLAIVALLGVLGLSSCSSGTEPSRSNVLLPVEDGVWQFQVALYDSTDRLVDNSLEIERQDGSSAIDNIPSHVWDGESWVEYSGSGGSKRYYGAYGEWSNTLALRRYAENGKTGTLFGVNNLSKGDRYLLRIPDQPTERIEVSAPSIQEVYQGEVAGGIYHATFDPHLVPVTVPAGSYQCHVLTLDFDGQISFGGLVFLQTQDSIFIAPGVGIVKHMLHETREQSFTNLSNDLEKTEDSKRFCELVGKIDF